MSTNQANHVVINYSVTSQTWIDGFTAQMWIYRAQPLPTDRSTLVIPGLVVSLSFVPIFCHNTNNSYLVRAWLWCVAYGSCQQSCREWG